MSEDAFGGFFSDLPKKKPGKRPKKKATAPKKKAPAKGKKSARPTRKKKAPVDDVTAPKPMTISEPDRRDHVLAVQWFFESIEPGNEPIYIGIDPGVEGAIGLIHPTDKTQTTAVDIPTIEIETTKKTKSKKGFRKRNVFDNGAVWELFKIIKEWRHRVVIALEKGQTRATDNGITGLSVGIGYGMWPLFLLSHELEMEEQIPGVWKKAMGLRGDDKELSRLKAQKLWPSAPLYRVGDHNRAEALLIAEYIRRTRSAA